MTKTVKTLTHTTAGFSVNVEGKTHAAILAEIKEAGYTLGTKSLAALLSGEKDQAGDFKVGAPAKKAAADKAKEAKAKKGGAKTHPEAPDWTKNATAEEPQTEVPADAKPGQTVDVEIPTPEAAKALLGQKGDAAEEAVVQALASGSKPMTLKARIEAYHAAKSGATNLTPEQQALVAQTDAEHGAAAKPSNKGVNWKEVLPQEPVAVLEGSKMHNLFKFLCRPEGASKQELMDEFGWSAGGLAGIIHWEPKAKGYFLGTEKVDGVIRYHLQFIGSGGRKVKPEEVLTRARAVAAPKAPKAPKEPKAAAPAAAPKAPTVAKRVPAADAPQMGGAAVTKRVAAKKAQPQA